MLVIEKLLNDTVNQLGGEDAALQACDRMYNASFSCGDPITVKQAITEGWDLFDVECYYKLLLVAQAKNMTVQQLENNEGEFLWDMLDHYQDQYNLDFNLPNDLLIVETCNYKGEGEGVTFYDQSMPVFKSKESSFYQANNKY